jgi:17beta-estradiol 17-dehydrogenase / very-long-chain 3-oxoacyl-CoA reductase
LTGFLLTLFFQNSDGIGKAYAFAFAKQGMSVVLISRTEAKLEAVKKEIEEKYSGVEVTYVVCDYSKFDKAAQDEVSKAIKDLEVGVLVNNVGVSYRYPMFFAELSDSEVQDLMTMNVESTVWMTRMVLPGMAERKKGAIVNISSASSMYTLPLLAEYSGAKSFIEKFSRALNAEYKSKNVTCQVQIPFYVATKLAKLRKSLTAPEPHVFVALAMKWVGHSDCVVSPYILHAIQGWILDILPEFAVESIIMNMHMQVRKKGIKKDAKKAEEAAGKKD